MLGSVQAVNSVATSRATPMTTSTKYSVPRCRAGFWVVSGAGGAVSNAASQKMCSKICASLPSILLYFLQLFTAYFFVGAVAQLLDQCSISHSFHTGSSSES
jgi:hypothetical protein